jgi:pimeloyl-ACP methyl ester carboxylesterase
MKRTRRCFLMAAYMLVGGAWLGGWCWRPVARRLREAGHEVYPVTPTGLGERSHLSNPEVDLDTHVTDVVNLVEFEDLRDVVLLGHSYAGIVVTGVADRIPELPSLLVYLDAGPAPAGASFLDTQPPEVREHTERRVAESGDGWLLPVPSWEELENVNGASLEGLGDEERRLMRSRATPQPYGTYTQPLRLEKPADGALPKALIASSFPLAQVREMIAGRHLWFRQLGRPEWRLLELPTGHWPMFSRPFDLAEVLLRLAPSAVDRGTNLRK